MENEQVAFWKSRLVTMTAIRDMARIEARNAGVREKASQQIIDTARAKLQALGVSDEEITALSTLVNDMDALAILNVLPGARSREALQAD